jgi:hypothetical protein
MRREMGIRMGDLKMDLRMNGMDVMAERDPCQGRFVAARRRCGGYGIDCITLLRLTNTSDLCDMCERKRVRGRLESERMEVETYRLCKGCGRARHKGVCKGMRRAAVEAAAAFAAAATAQVAVEAAVAEWQARRDDDKRDATGRAA